MKWLSGKKTNIGSVAAGLLAALMAADRMLNDGTFGWLSAEQYGMMGGLIFTWTGVAMRAAIAKGR